MECSKKNVVYKATCKVCDSRHIEVTAEKNVPVKEQECNNQIVDVSGMPGKSNEKTGAAVSPTLVTHGEPNSPSKGIGTTEEGNPKHH